MHLKRKHLSFLALLLSTVLIISASGINPIYVKGASDADCWDGTTLTSPNDLGDGMYEISSAEQLAYVIKNGGGEGSTFTLTQNIYLNELDKVNWKDGTVADGYNVNVWYQGNEVPEFTGTLDGNGYVVYGLYFNRTTSTYNCGAGLIPEMGKATIKNIGIDYSYIGFPDTYRGAAAIVGKTAQTAEGSISGCFAGEKVTVKGADVAAIAGGGNPLGEVIIENCYSLATLDGSGKIGVFTSDSWGLLDDGSPKFKINNCYCLGVASGSTWQAPRPTNVYATQTGMNATVVSTDALKGESAVDTLKNFDFENIWAVTGGYPTLKIFQKYVAWNGSVSEPLDIGDGFYEISLPSQLAYVIKNGGGAGNTYKLTCDIYLNELDKVDWSNGTVADGYTVNTWFKGNEVPEFSGTLDGNGHAVFGVYYNSTTSVYNCGAGLIPEMGKAVIKNIGVMTSYIGFADTCRGAAALVGKTAQTAEGSISCCFVGEDVTVKGVDVSAIAGGYNPLGEVIIENCYSLATLSGSGKVGAFTSDSWGLLDDGTPKFKIKNSYCLGVASGSTWQAPHPTNVYATQAGMNAKVVSLDSIKGSDADDILLNFDFENIWYAVNDTNKTPMLRVRGLAIRDVNGNGKGDEEADFMALRNAVFGTERHVNTDFNYDGVTDICDLVVFNSGKSLSASSDKYYSIADLREADLADGTIVDLSIKPYSVGKYKIVEDTAYSDNGYSVLAVESGKFAVRYYGENTVNNWNSEELRGSFVAHKAFNGYVDRWIVGEGGTTGTYPDNTLEGVEHAVRLGYKVVEIDITVTKDNIWVLNHDANTGMLYDSANSSKSQNMRDVTYDSIKDMPILRQTYYTGGWPTWTFTEDIKKEYIPTLESVFMSQRDTDTYFILDNKYLTNYTFTDEQMDALAEIIKKYNMQERCAAYAACLTPLAKRIPEIGVAYSGMPSSDEEIAANIIKSHKHYLMSIGDTQYSSYIDFCKKYDIPLAVWMTDDYIHADELFEQGVDYVLTNSIITADNLTECGYKIMDNIGTSEIMNSITFAGDGTNTVSGTSINLACDDTYSAQFTLSYSGLGLKAGDVLALTVDSNVLSGDAHIKIATDNGARWYEKNSDGTTTLYYLVNDSYTYDLIAYLIVNNGETDFSNVNITHYREVVRSGLS